MALARISVRNLRSLKTKQSFHLAPLSFAVGANSSGKSTFLRLFPLLRQSTETTTKGPILWFGKYVDFGIFDSVVSRGGDQKEIEFEFEIELIETEPLRPGQGISLQFLEDTSIIVGLTVASDQGLTYAKKISLNIFGSLVETHAESDGRVTSISLDGTAIHLGESKIELGAGDNLFTMVARRPRMVQSGEEKVKVWVFSQHEGLIQSQILSQTKLLFQNEAESEKTRYIAGRLSLGSFDSFKSHLLSMIGSLSSLTDRPLIISEKNETIDRLRKLVVVDRLPLLLEEISQMLAATFSGVRYMGPVRAVAQRFYRQQDLAVNEVDQAGENLAMFLMGLSYQRRKEFSTWCERNIGFRVEPRPDGAHVSVFLSDTSNGEMYNIADMGFGYSQILPLLATIWLETSNSISFRHRRPVARRRGGAIPVGGTTVVIEQPELHLHPRMQARFADLLISVVTLSTDNDFPIRFICETHSEVIINRIGFRISQGRLDPRISNVYLFEKLENSEETTVSQAAFDKSGVLQNWPYGFFLPDLD